MKFSISSLLLLAASATAGPLKVASMQPGPKYNRLNANESLLLVVDEQTGLYPIVSDFNGIQFKNNMLAHAALGKLFRLPTIITTSAESGANGPTVGEILEMYPDAPLIMRGGEVNAWDNSEFRDAVRETNKTQIILAGIMTDVCTAFLALSLREEGYEVFANHDASGTVDELTRDMANLRMMAAGVQLLSTAALTGELMRDWRNTNPAAPEFIAYTDKYSPDLGMALRNHRDAVLHGELMPGQEDLP